MSFDQWFVGIRYPRDENFEGFDIDEIRVSLADFRKQYDLHEFIINKFGHNPVKLSGADIHEIIDAVRKNKIKLSCDKDEAVNKLLSIRCWLKGDEKERARVALYDAEPY